MSCLQSPAAHAPIPLIRGPTQLEVGTLAFAVLNFLNYAFWWNKPLNVQCPHPVYWKSTEESRPEHHIDDPYRIDASGTEAGILLPIVELMGHSDVPTSLRLRVPTFDGSITLEDSDKTVLTYTALLMATIFGGIHCIAWFFAFPTHRDQVLWHMSAVATTFTPWLFLLYNLMELIGHICGDVIPDLILKVVALVISLFYMASITLYVIARGTLFVLMFTTLRNLPPDAYKAVSWTTLAPHL